MLVFAAFVPSSPLLLPSIGGDLARNNAIASGLERLEEEMKMAKPDTIVVISQGGVVYDDAFSVDMADPYTGDLRDFGDLDYRVTHHPDFAFVDALRRGARTHEVPLSLSTSPILSYPAIVALDLLAKHTQAKIVPLTPSRLNNQYHFSCGELLAETAHLLNKRLAVIATGSLFEDIEEEFRTQLFENLREKKYQDLIALPDKEKSSSYQELLILLGALHKSPSEVGEIRHDTLGGVDLSLIEFHVR